MSDTEKRLQQIETIASLLFEIRFFPYPHGDTLVSYRCNQCFAKAPNIYDMVHEKDCVVAQVIDMLKPEESD